MVNMKNIVIVVRNESKTRQVACQCMQRIVLSKEFSHPRCRDNTYIKVVTTDAGLLQVSDTHHPTNGWLLPEETISLLSESPQQKNTQEWHGTTTSTEMENLAKALHDVADTVPYLGVSLDLIFCLGCPEGDTTELNSFVPVIGAMKRLVDWHNGITVIVKLGAELSQLEMQIVELGHCQVVNSMDKLNLHWPGWRGKLAVMDHIENRGQMFPGFWLECSDWDVLLQQKLSHRQQQQQTCHKIPLRSAQEVLPSKNPVCGRTIEVLQEVDLRTFPFFLVDSWMLYLHFNDIESENLVQYMNSMEQVGLLARLRVYPEVNKVPVCGAINLNTVSWKDRIIADCLNVQEPTEEKVADDAVFLYLLLLPNMKSSNKSAPIIAQVLLTPNEINRNIVHSLQDYLHLQETTTRECTNDKDKEKFGDELVLDQRDEFVLMLGTLKENLRNALSEYQDGVAEGTNASHAILETAAKTQADVISTVFHDSIRLGEFLQGSMRPQLENRIHWISEAALDPSKFPEKLAMQATLATRKILQSFPSMDSLTASSPLSTAEVEKKKNFEMCDIFQYFNPDGSMKEVPKSAPKLKGRGLCRIDCHNPKHQWPESQLFRFHDVYYYNSDLDLGLEKRYSKVRDRGYFPDTLSSFLSPIKKYQPTKSAPSPSPVWWLHQRSASAQNLMASGVLDRLKRTSPRKKGMADGTFRQPDSQAYSPQKLSQVLCGSTSEFPSCPGSGSSGHSSADVRNIARDLTNRNSRHLSRTRSSDQKSSIIAGTSTCDHRKRSLTSIDHEMANKLEKKRPVLAAPLTAELPCPVRRSPRRSLGSLRSTPNASVNLSRSDFGKEAKNKSFENCQLVVDTPSQSCENKQSSAKMKRSDRHKLKLQRIIDFVLREKGVDKISPIYAACARNLFNVSLVLLKTLPTSQNLTEEMKTVVYSQVKQIINLEKRRCGIAIDV